MAVASAVLAGSLKLAHVIFSLMLVLRLLRRRVLHYLPLLGLRVNYLWVRIWVCLHTLFRPPLWVVVSSTRKLLLGRVSCSLAHHPPGRR